MTPALRILRTGIALCAALGLLSLTATPAAAQVSYFIFGQATSVHTPVTEVESEVTLAIPGVVPEDPEPAAAASGPVPLPGVTVEAYDAATNALLGLGQANRQGFYNLTYNRAVEANHQVRFLLFYDFKDGGRELVGSVDTNPAGDPIVVNNRLFSFNLQLINNEAVKAGEAAFSPTGEFLFIEVGDIDMDDIWDQQADAGNPASVGKLGLTKPPSAGHSLGPDLAFGATLELYGLFGEGTNAANTARYYRINYTGAASGSVCDPLYKKNYVLGAGSSVEVFRVLLGPKDPATLPPGLGNCVYELDERLAGQPIPGTMPAQFYSAFWTELGMRAKWNTRTVANGDYVLSVESWNAVGNPLPASGNDFSTLNLKINNQAPTSAIHNIQYLDGSIVLSDANPCQSVILNQVTASPLDDNLQFLITATHPANLLRQWQLFAWHGHNTADGEIAGDVYPLSAPPPVSQVFQTPAAITYQTCAYRFRLRVWPRITNGYQIVYIRDDNWYAAISVQTP